VISSLRILYLEDEPRDAELVRAALEAEGIACKITRVETEPEFSASLKQGSFDIILADYGLPSFDGVSALKIAQEICPALPCIIVSGTVGEEVAIDTLKLGATDYVLKTRLSRIVPSVQRALREAEQKNQRKRAEDALHRNEAYLAEAQRLSHTGSFGWQVSSGDIYWSEETFRIFGFESTIRPTLERVFERIHPEDRQLVRRVIDSAAQERKSFDFEHRLLMPNASVKYLRVVGRPSTKDESGELEFVGAVTDITNRRRDEAVLREQANLLHLTHDAILVRDLKRVITYWNLGAEELYGWRADEAVGQVPYELLRTVFPKPLEEIEAEVVRTGRWEGELTQTRKDGTAVVAASRWSLQRDDMGAPIAILVTNNDVSQRKAAEQARQETEEQWRAAFESNPTMYFMVGEAGEIVSVNAFGAEQLGYTVVELVGQPVLNVFYESDRDAVQKHAKECFEHPGRMMRWEARKIRKDGTMLWVRETANAVVLKKQPVLLVACENITEQKRAEEAVRRSEKELRDLIDTIPTMAWSALPDGSNAFVTRQWTEYTGLSAEQMSGSGWQSTVHPEDLDRHLEKWGRALTTGQALDSEVRLRHAANGQYRWFLIRGVPSRNKQANISKWYGTATDIEDRKRAEDLLAGEKRILEMVAKGDSLPQILDSLCRLVEEQASGVLASILLVQDNMLRHGGAPSLPKAYTEAIDGVLIGPSVGSCGTAAYSKEQVIVEDIATDPLWANFREAALSHSLRACWSTPIFSAQGTVIATFAMYYREPKSPSPRDQEIIEQITNLAGVAIERKQTQEALRRSETYLAEAQRLSKTGSWAFNPITGKTHYWSNEMFRVWGFDPQQGPPDPETVLQRIHPDDRERMRSSFESGLAGRLTSEVIADHRILLPDGTVKYIHGISYPVFDEAGRVVEYVGTAVDVTERKRAEEALRRSEVYLSESQRLTKTGSWAYNPFTGKTLYWSDEMFRIFGLNSQEGPSSEKFWQLVHPEDRDRVRKRVESEAPEKAEYVDEYRILLADGTLKRILDIGHPVFSAAGDVLEFVGTTVDVTERKQAEQAFRRSEAYLAEAQKLSKTGSWAWDPRTDRMLYCSEELYRMFDIALAEGMPSIELFRQRVHPEDRDRVTADAVRTSGDKTAHTLEYKLLLPDGTIKHVESRERLIFDEAGELIEVIGTVIDVTERKRAEDEVRASETRFRTYVDHATDALLVHDEQGVVLDVNQQACASLGYTREELIGMHPRVFNPAIDAAAHQRVRERLEAGDRFSFETTHRRKDGTVFSVEVRLRPFRDGGRVFCLALVQDITERKRAEEQLRESEGRFRTIFENAGAGVALVDGQGRPIKCNPTYIKMLGYTEEELRNMVFTEFTHPDDIDLDWGLYGEVAEGKRDRYDIEKRYIRKDGRVMWGQLIVSRVKDNDGSPTEYMVAMVEDITERKHTEEELWAAEARFRMSVDHLTDALFIHDDEDEQGRVIDVNQQACESLGYTREELIGMTAFDYDAVQDPAAMKSIKERLARGEIFSFESAHRRKDGTVYPVEVRVRPFLHGEHRFGLAVVRDITDRKRSEQERERLRQLEADIAHINRVSMMGELAASLAHEIKQPIAAAVSNAEASLLWLSREEPNLVEVREATTEMIKEARRAAEIITRTRALFKKDEIRRDVLDLNEVINDTASLIRVEAYRLSISVRTVLDPGLPRISADRVQLQQVLTNLMFNGLEAMKDCGGELIIRSQGGGEGRPMVSVSDVGVGLPLGKGDKIFDAFFTTKPQGTGMGLAICRSIVESHGGHLWATSNSPRGAIFSFTLPIEVAKSA
jgi:PAS domain S-box-containing protein